MDAPLKEIRVRILEGQNERMIAQVALYRGLVPVNLNPTISPAPSDITSALPTAQPSLSIAPSSAPTSCESDSIIVTILTDNFPLETSWTLEDDCRDQVLGQIERQFYTDSGTLYEHIICNPGSMYTFTIFDAYGDGICCGVTGNGSYSVTLNGDEVASGGQFEDSEQTVFGAQDCLPIPSNLPTSSHVPSISPAPSNLPIFPHPLMFQACL